MHGVRRPSLMRLCSLWGHSGVQATADGLACTPCQGARARVHEDVHVRVGRSGLVDGTSCGTSVCLWEGVLRAKRSTRQRRRRHRRTRPRRSAASARAMTPLPRLRHLLHPPPPLPPRPRHQGTLAASERAPLAPRTEGTLSLAPSAPQAHAKVMPLYACTRALRADCVWPLRPGRGRGRRQVRRCVRA
jgi:hypothetical protein